MMALRPYRTTPVFDEHSLPAALRQDHSTKAGVWGIIRVLEGRLRLSEAAGSLVLSPHRPGLIHPEREHRVEPIGRMRMQVEFYDEQPLTGASGA
jgi:tellurite resistance-related uncharacterized protein